MQWFKHDTNSTMDFKIKKLLIRYGAIGYAVYFHCLELIADTVDVNNITFELEHDSEIIADDLRINGTSEKSGRELVEEIMRYMVELNLFQEDNGHIFCFKMLKRIDTSMTSNAKFREMINEAKKNHDGIMITSDNVMQDKIRQEKTRKDKKRLKEIKEETEKTKKHKFGTYQNVLLTVSEKEKLETDLGAEKADADINHFSGLKEMKGYKYKNDNLAIRNWGIDAYNKYAVNKPRKQQYTDEEYEAMCDDVENEPY